MLLLTVSLQFFEAPVVRNTCLPSDETVSPAIVMLLAMTTSLSAAGNVAVSCSSAVLTAQIVSNLSTPFFSSSTMYFNSEH